MRNRAFQQEKFLYNPTEFIFEKLKILEKSPEIHNQLVFKVLVFFVLHGGEIAKGELDDILHHALFADLKEKIDLRGFIDICFKHLLDLCIEETADGQCYRIPHDVITRCTFLAAMENHRTLLLTNCNPILIFAFE